MKTLFVATDFSNAAHNALLYALAMAKPFGAKVILFHAYQVQVLAGVDTAMLVAETDTKKVVEDRLRQHLLAINESEVDIELLYGEGPAARTILETAVAQGADMIISGMKNHGKTFRQFFGSTVTELAQASTLPLIVVPETASYRPPHKIALASDIAPETDSRTLDSLATIGERFHSKLYIVRVIRDRFEEVYELLHRPAKLNRLPNTLETEYTYTQNKSVPEALDFFIHAAQINLLAMVPHKHTLLEKWFFKSNTKAMIFKSDIPLLILPEGERK
ncbi:universal stress protein [Paraflavitalea speifideaquila]|uniref:universal stress protein n=1 Tax=Paraflavitalea speifideaquila TaxID=3076558 RepID=UPI0028E35C67|nr:universal stress protein [Paraflavitalea speifideiaquila]